MQLATPLGLLLLIGLLAGPVLADQPHDGMDSARQGRLRLAQMTPEQRERLRERWEHTSPEDRNAIRRELRERVQNIPPEQREQVRNRLIERMQRSPYRERANRLDDDVPGIGFGQGFEQRHERMDRPRPEVERANHAERPERAGQPERPERGHHR